MLLLFLWLCMSVLVLPSPPIPVLSMRTRLVERRCSDSLPPRNLHGNGLAGGLDHEPTLVIATLWLRSSQYPGLRGHRCPGGDLRSSGGFGVRVPEGQDTQLVAEVWGWTPGRSLGLVQPGGDW